MGNHEAAAGLPSPAGSDQASVDRRLRALETWRLLEVAPRLRALELAREEDHRLIVEGLGRLEGAIVSGVDSMNVVALRVQTDLAALARVVNASVASVEGMTRVVSDMVAEFTRKESTHEKHEADGGGPGPAGDPGRVL